MWPAQLRFWVIVAFTAALPLFVSPHGDDTFRQPKELLVRAEAIVIAALILASFISASNTFRSFFPDRFTSAAILSVMASTALATLFSTNRPISLLAAGYTLSFVIVFWAMYEAAGKLRLPVVMAIGAGPALVNLAIALGQRLHWWTIFEFPATVPARERVTGFVGNPNDVGACLAITAVAASAYAIATRKPIAMAMAAALFGGVFVADSLTSMITVVVTYVLMMWFLPRRLALLSTAALVVITLFAFGVVPPLRTRMHTLIVSLRTHDYDALSSHRALPFASAWSMFRDHPVLGAGPGTFKWHYLPYRLQVELKHPQLYLSIVQNLGEVHNDHLQVLAEEGLLGYASAVLCLLALASRTWMLRNRRRDEDERIRFAYYAALPLATAWAVLAIAAFPLELPSVMTPLLLFSACILRWSGDVVPA